MNTNEKINVSKKGREDNLLGSFAKEEPLSTFSRLTYSYQNQKKF
jgi:hypothetical protein